MHDRIVFAALTRLAAVNGGLHRLVRREPFEVGQRQLGLQLRGVGLGALHLATQSSAWAGQRKHTQPTYLLHESAHVAHVTEHAAAGLQSNWLG